MLKWVFFSLFFFGSSFLKAASVLMLLSDQQNYQISETSLLETSYSLEEFTKGYTHLQSLGHDVHIATVGGAPPQIAIQSTNKQRLNEFYFLKELQLMENALLLKKRVVDSGKIYSLKNIVDQKTLENYEALFVLGAANPVYHWIGNEDLARTLRHFHVRKKVTALLGHGATALLSTQSFGSFLYKGYRITGTSKEEQKKLNEGSELFQSLEELLVVQGVRYLTGTSFEAFLVEDRELLSAQNTASMPLLLEALERKLR